MSEQFFDNKVYGDTAQWPESIPADLRLRMMDALSYRQCSPDAIWDEIRDWLEDNRVRVTFSVLLHEEVPISRPRGSTKYTRV
ncbi:hypothetical protein [Phaeovulum sp.]|uniref:hypothetical protein n=1 Tax=Phaeovulum sp. TaxID=2934796 RepID=UPI0039E385CF